MLEHDCPATSFIVLLQTVLQELRHLNLAAYRRVFALLRDENRSFIFYPNELSTDTATSRYDNIISVLTTQPTLNWQEA